MDKPILNVVGLRRVPKKKIRKKARLYETARSRMLAFVEHFAKTHRAGDSARAAGYKSPAGVAPRLLSHPFVINELEKRRCAAEKKHSVDRDRIMREYVRVAFHNMRDVAEWTEAGVKFVPSTGLDEAVSAAIQEVSSQNTTHGVSVKIKAHDKLHALDSLSKILGYFQEQPQAPNVTAVVRLSLEDDTADVVNTEDVEPEDDVA